MDVSIVIVSFNTCRLLDECIASIKKETRCSHEIIVVDNASTDESCGMLRKKYPDVRLIENEKNVGFAKANNQGFAIASGRYYLMLNPDTVVLEGAIDKLIAFMDQNPGVGICSPRNVDREGNLQRNCDHFPSFWNNLCSYTNLVNIFPKVNMFRRSRMLYWDYSDLRDVDRVMGCSLMIRVNLYHQLGGMDENYFMYFEETDLCYRSKKSGYRTVYIPYASLIHYHGESTKEVLEKNVINRTIIDYHYKSQYYFLKKNYGMFQMLVNRLLDCTYGLSLIMRNVFRSDKIKRNLSLKKGKALISAALKT